MNNQDDSRKGQTVTVGGDKYRVLYEWIDDNGNVCFATEKKRPQQVFFHLKDRALRVVFILRERVNEVHNLNLELREATKQIAFLLTQNVRLQGRVEGLLIASGKLQLIDERKKQ